MLQNGIEYVVITIRARCKHYTHMLQNSKISCYVGARCSASVSAQSTARVTGSWSDEFVQWCVRTSNTCLHRTRMVRMRGRYASCRVRESHDAKQTNTFFCVGSGTKGG